MPIPLHFIKKFNLRDGSVVPTRKCESCGTLSYGITLSDFDGYHGECEYCGGGLIASVSTVYKQNGLYYVIDKEVSLSTETKNQKLFAELVHRHGYDYVNTNLIRLLAGASADKTNYVTSYPEAAVCKALILLKVISDLNTNYNVENMVGGNHTHICTSSCQDFSR